MPVEAFEVGPSASPAVPMLGEDSREVNGNPINLFIDRCCCCFKSKQLQEATAAVKKTVQLKVDRYHLNKLLEAVPLLKRLTKQERTQLANACVEQIFEAGTKVIQQGDIGSEFFIISAGEATVSKKQDDGSEHTVVVLKRGDWFGENALLCDEPRMASVTASSSLSTLKISRQLFTDLGMHQKIQFAKRKAVGGAEERQVETKPAETKTEEEVEFIRKALWGNENLATMLANLDADKINSLIGVAWKQEVADGEAIITAGDYNADYFYIVKKGSFDVTNRIEEKDAPSSPTSKVGSLARMRTPSTHSTGSTTTVTEGKSAEEAMMRSIEVGDCFGELALLYLTQRTATVLAAESSEVWVIDRPNFKKVLMEKSEERINEYAKMLDGVEILACLAAEEKRELANAFVEMQFTEGEVIVQQGEPGKIFYILYDGEVTVNKDGTKIKDMSTRGQFFGERALLADEPRTATISVKSEKARVLALDHESFGLLLGPLTDLMNQDKNQGSRKTNARQSILARKTLLLPPKKLSKKVAYEDLKKIGLLGNGGFGCVELYQNKSTGDVYALKSMSKGHIVKVGMQNAVVNEKNVLNTADSPFIVKLYATYNWSQTVVFLLELLPGGELYATYTKENLFGSEVHAKYYGSMVVIAFDHLHSHRIIYRDLKPENIVLKADGVPKLIDMGLAKRVVGKTYTTCGTPDYFAPEVITGAGHNHAVDWWTLGIFIFETLGGNPPFTASAPMQIFKNVLGGIRKVTLPKKCQGIAGDLIKSLLKKDPTERLPMRAGGVSNIKKSDWYAKYDWKSFEDLSMKAPYRPKVKDPTDLSNFSARAEDMPQQVHYEDDGTGWDAEFED